MPHLRRLLVVAESFYPHRATSAIRITQWCRYLPEFGWKPIVLCRYFGVSASAAELAAAVHLEVELHYLDGPKNSAWSAEGANAEQVAIRRWSAPWVGRMLAKEFLVPDRQVAFWRQARGPLAELAGQTKPHALLTTSPPHSVHSLGLWLADRDPLLPWVADFRDPYLIDRRYRPRRLRLLQAGRHRRFEADVYSRAALITHAVDFHARWARRRYPGARDKIRTLPNGVPAELLEQHIEPVRPSSGRRAICAMGTSDHAQRVQLVRVVARLCELGHDLELRLIGPQRGGEEKLVSLLGSRFVATGNLPHREVFAHLLGGDVLVCMLNERHSQGMGLSSKLFEYLACGKPIVVINPTRPDRLLVKPLRGVCALPRPSDEQLQAALQCALSPAAAPPAEQTHMVRQRFSRRSQTAQLAEWLDAITRVHEAAHIAH